MKRITKSDNGRVFETDIPVTFLCSCPGTAGLIDSIVLAAIAVACGVPIFVAFLCGFVGKMSAHLSQPAKP